MLILKENAANSVPTPPVGKDTFFIDDSGTPSVKNAAGTVTTFPVVNASNSQVVFMNGSSLSGEAALTYDFNNNILNISGNLAATNIKTDNLLYANGSPWDLQQPGGSNTQIQFNDADSFGGSAAFTFNKSSNLVSMGGALSVTGNANVGNLGTAQVLATANVTAPQLISNVSTGTAPLVVSSTTRVANLDVAKAGIANTVNDAAQPNITSVGTLTSLSVTGNASAGNISTGGVLSVTGNANVGNLGAAAGVFTANVSAGNLSTGGVLSVTGNGNLGNVGAAAGVFTANVSAGNLSTGGELSVSGNAIISGNLTVDGNLVYVNVDTLAVEDPIIQLQTGPNGAAPSSNSGKDVGSALNYYDSQARVAFMGWDVSNAEFGLASQATIASEVVTFSTYGNLRAGVYFGNAAGLTNIPGGNIVGNISGNISNAAHAVTSNTVVDAAQPNITSVGTLTSVAVTGNASAGNFNTAGKVVASTFESNVSTGTAPLVVASTTKVTNLNADLLDGYSTDTAATANTIVVRNADGNITGNNISGTLSTASQPSITSVGTLTSLVVSGSANTGAINPTGHIIPTADETYDLGNATNRFRDLWISGNSIKIGNSQIKSNATALVLQNPDGGQVVVSGNSISSSTTIVNGNSNVNIPSANGNVNISATGTANVLVVTSTGVNVAGTLNATGNANVGNLGTAGLITATGNVSGGNLTTAGVVAATGNVSGGNLTTAGVVAATGNVSGGNLTTAGALSVTGNANVGNLGTAGLIVATGNVTGGNLVTGGALSVTGNANVGNLGTAGLVVATGNVTGGNLVTSGALSVTGNANVGNLGTAQVLATANITAPQLISNVSTGTAPFVVTSQTKVTNLNADLLDGMSTNTLNTGLTIVNRDADGSFAANIITATLSGAATTAGTVTTNAQPNITSVGTLTSLAVTGNATAGNVYANAGTIGAANLTGTLTTAAQPNITSVGTLSSLTATGNVAAGNLTTTGVLSVTGTGVSSIAGNLDMTSNTIINLATPTNASDAATKQYVDDVAQGLNVHDAAAAATTGTLATATGGTITYNNGTSGVGATLTTTGTYTTIDGVNIATVGTRVLVKNEANAAHNGIYTYTSSTVLTRATDYDSVPEVEAGDFVFVTGGTLYDNTGWVQTSTVATIGTDAIDFTQFSGAGTYNAGTGLTLTGTTFSVNVAQPTITSLGTLTGLGVNGTITGVNITANTGVFTGNANGLSSVQGANVVGTLNSTTLGNSTLYIGTTAIALNRGTASQSLTGITSIDGYAATVSTAAQPNITSVGTLTSLTVTGNASAGNISTGGVLSVTGNANVGNIGAAAGVFTSVSGNGAALTDLNASNISSGTLAQARLANSTLTLGNTTLTLGGTTTTVAGLTNITSTQFTSNVATGTAPLVVTSTTRVANLNVATSGVANTVNDAAQPNITSVGTLTSLGVSGTVTAPNFTANTGVFTGNGNGLSSLQGANFTGTINSTVLGNSSLFIGTTSIALNRGTGAQSLTGITSIDGYAATVSTAAQPNITSVGTLTSLNSSGNITAPNLIANTGFVISSINAAVSAAGTAQGNATALTREVNVTSTVASGAGVALPAAVAGMRVTIINTAANAVLVYPASGGTINSLALNAAFSQAAGARLDFIATTGTQWYTLNATYL